MALNDIWSVASVATAIGSRLGYTMGGSMGGIWLSG